MAALKGTLYSVLVILLWFMPNQLSASTTSNSFVLVLDAGHGGKDPGAGGRKAKEKNINLAVTLLAGKYISEKYPDITVLYTRKSDVYVTLDKRANFANKSQANLFISIHANASAKSPSARGMEVYAFGVSRTKENLEVVKQENSVIYLEENYEEKYHGFDPNSAESQIIFEFLQGEILKQSLEFATMVHNEMKSCAPWKGRGVKQASFLVLREVSMSSVLIELDFISNSEAEKLMMSEAGQKKYAQAICNAIGKYKASYDRVNNSVSLSMQQSQTGKETVGNVKSDANQPANNAVTVKPAASAQRVYKVQLMSLPKPLPANSPYLKGYKASYYVENKQYKYTCGESTDWAEISRIHKSVLKDFKDAFIVAFENGVKVPVR